MAEEFNLSDKIQGLCTINQMAVMAIETNDVKEFIKRLKADIVDNVNGYADTGILGMDELITHIDKLAGEKLI